MPTSIPSYVRTVCATIHHAPAPLGNLISVRELFIVGDLLGALIAPLGFCSPALPRIEEPAAAPRENIARLMHDQGTDLGMAAGVVVGSSMACGCHQPGGA